jgi:hypothetical protein
LPVFSEIQELVRGLATRTSRLEQEQRILNLEFNQGDERTRR